MTKIFCDRCKKEMCDKHQKVEIDNNEYDLCVNCFNDTIDFIINNKENDKENS